MKYLLVLLTTIIITGCTNLPPADLNGKGKFTYDNGYTYVGNFKNGMANGKGTFTNLKGDKWVGEWKVDKDMMIGQGTLTWGGDSGKGFKYVGSLKGKIPENWDKCGTENWSACITYKGQGTLDIPEGNSFYGNVKRMEGLWGGYPETMRVTFHDNENVYNGEIQSGKMSGQGTLTYPNGVKFEGEWKDGESMSHYKWKGNKQAPRMKEQTFLGGRSHVVHPQLAKKAFGPKIPQGTFIFPNGNKYVGNFKNGMANGKGEMTLNSSGEEIGILDAGIGVTVNGLWKNNELTDGEVKIFGTKYYYGGGMKDGKFDGQGLYIFETGFQYEGGWKNGKRHSKGISIYTNKRQFHGTWEYGRAWTGKYYQSNGQIFNELVKGKPTSLQKMIK
jgi:hypothetical protein